MPKTVSIAMATYCGARFLTEQLASLANQTLTPFELVVCDDRSSDETVALLQRFAEQAPFPVRIHQNETNLGFIENFLKAISLCQGDYVACSDQDDIWEPNKLQAAVDALELTGAWLHSHAASLIDAEGNKIGSFSQCGTSGLVSLAEVDPWNTFFGFTCTFKRELLSLVPLDQRPVDLIYNDRLMAHDRWITSLALLLGPVFYAGEELARYRQHGRNVFSAKPRGLVSKMMRVRTKYVEYLSKRLRIAQAMVEISRKLNDGGMRTESAATSIWIDLEARYRSRFRIFERDLGFGSQIGRAIANAWRDRDLKNSLEDMAAVIMRAQRP